jgi:hypothetical protein
MLRQLCGGRRVADSNRESHRVAVYCLPELLKQAGVFPATHCTARSARLWGPSADYGLSIQ